MNLPNFNLVYETFIPIDLISNSTSIEKWHQFINQIRNNLIPLFDDLKEKELIGWFSFLVHNKQSGGIPTSENDERLFFHVRLELSPDKNEEELKSNLPAFCEMTRKTVIQSPFTISGIRPEHLKNNDYREAWKIIGELTELVINIIKAHKSDKQIPIEHIAQFLHFLGNQLYVRAIGIPMP